MGVYAEYVATVSMYYYGQALIEGKGNIFYIAYATFNGAGRNVIVDQVTKDNISTYVYKMWRLKK